MPNREPGWLDRYVAFKDSVSLVMLAMIAFIGGPALIVWAFVSEGPNGRRPNLPALALAFIVCSGAVTFLIVSWTRTKRGGRP